MRPAGMSSDEDFDDEDIYFSINEPLRRRARNDPEGVAVIERVLDDKEAFHKAAEQCDIDLMTTLLQNGISADESNPNEWTPLMKACSRGNYEVVDFLLNNGADPDAKRDLFTPLMACCICSYVQEEGRLFCVRNLIERGANVNAQDKYGSTALMAACASGLDSIVAELVSVPETEINAQDKEGWNALFFAVNGNHKSIAKRLLDAGIDYNMSNKKGFTPVQWAQAKGFGEMVELLSPPDENNVVAVRGMGEPLVEFLHEMPDVNGEGGFYNDVRDIFLGLGMEKIYDSCKIHVSLQDFLLMGEELEKLGIKLEPLRWKIKAQGIHRYHIYPWKKSSLHSLDRGTEFSLVDAINCLANVTKHLSLMCATLKYLKMRIPHRIKGNNSINKEVITSLVNAYSEVNTLFNNLKHITEISKKIHPIGHEEVDLIRPKKKNSQRCHYYALFAGSVMAFLYYKLR